MSIQANATVADAAINATTTAAAIVLILFFIFYLQFILFRP